MMKKRKAEVLEPKQIRVNQCSSSIQFFFPIGKKSLWLPYFILSLLASFPEELLLELFSSHALRMKIWVQTKLYNSSYLSSGPFQSIKVHFQFNACYFHIDHFVDSWFVLLKFHVPFYKWLYRMRNSFGDSWNASTTAWLVPFWQDV